MNQQYRILFTDLDGTLIGEGNTVSERTMRALRKTEEAGCVIVACTGRARLSAAGIIQLLKLDGYGIVLNGASTVDWKTGNVIRRAALPHAVTLAAIQTTYDLGLAPVCLGLGNDDSVNWTDRKHPAWPMYAELNTTRLQYMNDLLTGVNQPVNSVAAYGTEHEMLALSSQWRADLPTDIRIFAGPTSYYQCWYAQITAAEADKAVAAQALAEKLSIPREETIALGDHVNDVELLRWAGLGVCMGDGDETARAGANCLTGTFAEDGAAQAIDHYILHELI